MTADAANTAPTAPTAAAGAAARFGRSAAWTALAAGGVLWCVASLVGGSDGTPRFYLSETIWVAAQTALLIGTVALWRLRPHGVRRAGTAGFVIATAGRAVFVVAEGLALVLGVVQDDLLPVAALLTAFGMIVVGVAVIREGRWGGWTRFVPLATGIYPVLAMFPFAATSLDGPPVASLTGWGLVVIALGAAAKRNEPAHPAPSAPRHEASADSDRMVGA